MVDDPFRVALTHDAAALLLDAQGRLPRLEDELGRVLAQLGNPLPNVVPVGVGFLPKSHGGVDAEVLVEEARRGEPHPVGVVQGPVAVDQKTVEYLGPLLPTQVEVPPCQEAGGRVAGEVVDPPLHPQLGHDRVDEGVARAPFLPSSEKVGVGVPVDLLANRVALHLVEVGRRTPHQCEVFPPEELAVEGHGWEGPTLFVRSSGLLCGQGLLERVPEDPRGETPEL
mmetsp:Transcript_19796/g.44879  ORF Transcript_19796/g.44879 Transcript_19796/m.44879 type:complete len:226 (+) Transcript_19796:297-974(+)